MQNQQRPEINPIFWLKYPMSPRQIVFLASQSNTIIQKTPNIGPIEQFCTSLSNIFKQVAGRQTQLRSKPVKKYIGEIGLERPKNVP